MPKREKRSCESNPLEKGCHAVDLRQLAIETLQTYFSNKSWFVGGSIPVRELLSDSSVKTILRTQFDDVTFNYIHEQCLSKVPAPAGFEAEPNMPWSVVFLLQLLSEMKMMGFPKDFQPGLILLYFKFCKGQKIPPPPLI